MKYFTGGTFTCCHVQGSGGGSAGRAVTSNTRDPQFKSRHWQNCKLKIEKTKIKKKRPGMAHLLKKCIGSLGKLCWAIFLRSLTVKTIVTKG